MMNNSQGASSFFSGLSTLLGRPHPLLHNLSDTTKKHVLGVREGASENAEVTSALLEDLVERGLDPGRRRLFVIDGSKALRKAIEKVFGQRHPIQRCRNHKLRNVLGHLPKDQHPQVKAAFRAAMKLDAKQGEQKLEQLARWLERDHPSASASLREGLSEMFTINRLGRGCPKFSWNLK